MKASDICIGDWLNIYTFPNDNPKQDDLFPAKVSAVSIFDPFKEPDDVLVELVIERTKGIASRPLDTCLPIELTEEILEKNGFVYREEEETCATNAFHHWQLDGHWFGLNYTQYFRKEKKDDMPRFDVAGIAIHYVHQLQHLLRMCGIEKEIEL